MALRFPALELWANIVGLPWPFEIGFTTVKARPYQAKAARAVDEAWQDAQSALVVMPTGTGKTVLFADIIARRLPRRALVIAHREELIRQAADKIQALAGVHCDIEMADQRAAIAQPGLWSGAVAPVVVSSVQTLTAGGDGSGRMTRFQPDEFDTLVIDEAHHATSNTYRRVLNYFGQNPNCRILGVTATPDRSDEEALGQVFETVAFDYEILDAIRDGWLVPIKQQMVSVESLDFSGIRTTAGDLNGADLAAVLETENALHQIAGPSVEIIGKQRAIVFCAGVSHAERMAEIFCRHGVSADSVSGRTDKERRRGILADFSTGKIQVVCNCGVLTEGFDDPGVGVVVMARPTKSRSLYAQMVGRATRPLPGLIDQHESAVTRCEAIKRSPKPCCLVVDFVGNAGRHKLVSTGDILGGNVSPEAIERATRRAKERGSAVDMREVLDEEQQAIENERKEEAARRARLTFKPKYSTQGVDPFDVLDITPPEERGWDRGKKLTDRQADVLRRQGINPDKMPYTQAKALLDTIFERWDAKLCTYKQAKTLKRYGYQTEGLTMENASKLLDGLAKNGWKKPASITPPPPIWKKREKSLAS